MNQDIELEKKYLTDAIIIDPDVWTTASDATKNDKQFVLFLLERDDISPVLILKECSKTLQNDREIISKAIGLSPLALAYASARLKDDKDLILQAIDDLSREDVDHSTKSYLLLNVSHRLKNDKDIFMKLLSNSDNESCLYYAGKQIQDDRECVLAAIEKNPKFLSFASDRLKSDKEIVFRAYKADRGTFKFFSDELRDEFGRLDGDEVFASLKHFVDKLLLKLNLEQNLSVQTEESTQSKRLKL